METGGGWFNRDLVLVFMIFGEFRTCHGRLSTLEDNFKMVIFLLRFPYKVIDSPRNFLGVTYIFRFAHNVIYFVPNKKGLNVTLWRNNLVSTGISEIGFAVLKCLIKLTVLFLGTLICNGPEKVLNQRVLLLFRKERMRCGFCHLNQIFHVTETILRECLHIIKKKATLNCFWIALFITDSVLN